MDELIRGTTPTVIIQFRKLNVSTITTAYLVMKADGVTTVEKTLAEATVDTEEENNDIRWTQTQEETLRFNVGQTVTVCCDWKQDDETRGRSKIAVYKVAEPGKNEVI